MNNRTETYQNQIERALRAYFPPAEDGAEGLRDAMRYMLSGGGKRLRPLLCLEFCRVCGGDTEAALPVACGVEMLHTYSLIHDDLPCMDDDAVRRGRASCHIRYGETVAVLAGDCLQAEAFAAVCSAEIPAADRARCVAELARAAGGEGICGGQYADLLALERTPEVLLATDVRKTAVLIGAACAMGAAAAGAEEPLVAAARTYGERLGMAFQLRDDCLDGDGLCAALGRRACEELTERYTVEALEGLEPFADADYLRTLTRQLAGREE